MSRSTTRLSASILAFLFLATAVVLPLAAGPDEFKTWPPRKFLVRSLVKSVAETLKAYHPETGRFGSEPWVCGDQNVVFPLAVAWSLKDAANPYYHDAKLLAVIGKGGEALVDDQDADGKWIFKKKDYSTWGQIHMPWTYSRWIRAYVLVKDAMPAAQRAKWEKGLKLGFEGIRKEQMGPRLQNIPCHHAMALYIAGQVFKNEDWKQAAAEYQGRIIKEQYPEGFWTENSGPVVSYNMVYSEALGTYYARSKDPAVLEALKRAVNFHAAVLWSDGTSEAAVDERVIYHKSINTGNVGFSFTPEGRGFILGQLAKETNNGEKTVGGDYAASLLLDGGKGPVVPLAAGADRSMSVIGKNDAVLVRQKPWEWAVSGYATKPIQNRWIQDRQNFVDVFHGAVGLIAGGGNTKLQPYWSTFTVGDPSFLHHQAGEEEPNFIPAIDLLWAPDKAALAGLENPTRLNLTYGALECSVTVEVLPDGGLALTYAAPQGKGVEGHLPLLKLADAVRLGNGTTLALSEKEIVLDAANIGDQIVFGPVKVTVPPGASIRWPSKQHNPYTKDGRSELEAAKLVLCLPFDTTGSQRVVLSVAK